MSASTVATHDVNVCSEDMVISDRHCNDFCDNNTVARVQLVATRYSSAVPPEKRHLRNVGIVRRIEPSAMSVNFNSDYYRSALAIPSPGRITPSCQTLA